MDAVTEQPIHAELTTMDLLLKERGLDQSKFCQTRGREESRGGTVLVQHNSLILWLWRTNKCQFVKTILNQEYVSGSFLQSAT